MSDFDFVVLCGSIGAGRRTHAIELKRQGFSVWDLRFDDLADIELKIGKDEKICLITDFSKEEWLNALNKAIAGGYFCHFIYVGTEDCKINVSRALPLKEQTEKEIRDSYKVSTNQGLKKHFEMFYSFLFEEKKNVSITLIDNSNDQNVFLSLDNKKIHLLTKDLAEWARKPLKNSGLTTIWKKALSGELYE